MVKVSDTCPLRSCLALSRPAYPCAVEHSRPSRPRTTSGPASGTANTCPTPGVGDTQRGRFDSRRPGKSVAFSVYHAVYKKVAAVKRTYETAPPTAGASPADFVRDPLGRPV